MTLPRKYTLEKHNDSIIEQFHFSSFANYLYFMFQIHNHVEKRHLLKGRLAEAGIHCEIL